MLGKSLLVIAVLCAFAGQVVEGGRLVVRPIPSSTVRQILRDAGREDAVPEGRIISHGLGALGGFALGLKKGILGVALADTLAAFTSNITLNSTTGAITVTKAKPTLSYNATTNQLCFTTRSAQSDIYATGDGDEGPEARANEDGYEEEEWEEDGSPTGYGTSPESYTPTMTSPSEMDATANEATASALASGAGSATNTATATTTQTMKRGVTCIII